MKAFGYIVSIYILLLAVLPCCAFDDCPEDKMQTEQLADHENGDEDCGTCSPFFNCEGCASVTTTEDPLHFNIIVLPAKQVYAGFLSPAIPAVQYDFWQPPRLAFG
jgi:hypothetical protein